MKIKKLLFLIIPFLILLSCENEKNEQDYIVFENNPLEKDIPFKPSNAQIEKLNIKLIDFLNSQEKPIYINKSGNKTPLIEQLKYYKRRYVGRMNIEGDKIIKVELVLVRCASMCQWKNVIIDKKYKDCIFSVQYRVEDDEIYGLNF